MLVILLLAIFVGLPLETLGIVSPTVVGVAITFLIISGIVAMVGRGTVTTIVGVVAVVSLVLRWLTEILPGRTLALWDLSFGILTLGLLTAFVLRHIFREGRITADRVRGGILAYLLLGLVWCLAYQLVDFLDAGALRFPGLRQSTPGRLSHDLAYYSYITLTTVGYGDITPVSPVARALAMGEALVGQLYPAILIARLVSQQIAAGPSGDRP
jgi:hypothetical protein